MKNRILALFLILIIFVSMLPLNVFAVASTLDFTKQKGEAKGYKMEYYAPEGYTDVFILKSDTSYTLYYVQEGGQYKCNSNGYGKITTDCARIFSIKTLDDLYDILFLGKYDSYSFDVVKAGGNVQGTINQMYVSMSLDSLASVNTQSQIDQAIREDFTLFNDFYIEWYYEEFGFFPPLINDVETDVEFMKGNYYAILSQETIIRGGGTSFDGVPVYSNYGYVETVDDVSLETDIVTSVNGQKRGLTYVVISSERPTGDIIGTSIANDGLINFVIGSIGKIGIWLDAGTRRNNYDIVSYMFYNNEENLNRYYFKSKQDACKFVLYGTAGAKYLYKEEGKTDYGYGYMNCEFNNYDLNGFPERKIPEENYPLGRQEIILTQHDVTGEGRKFIYIDMNYYARVSMLDSEYNLIINNKYTNAIYLEHIQEKTEIDPLDKTIYKVNSSMGVSKTTTFKLYHKELGENDKDTWIVLYSTYGIYQVKQGTIIDGEATSEQIVQVWKDKDGNLTVENTASGEAYKNGDTDAFKQNEDGEWINSKGEKWDKENYTNEILDWQKQLKQYQNKIEQLADIIEDFTTFINSSTEQIGEITGFLNAVMLSFPSIFRTLILLSIMALVFGRAIKRGD